MNVSGFWTGKYTYDGGMDDAVSFQAELHQLGAILEGQTTEQNTFDDMSRQILVADLFGTVSRQNLSFTKTYRNSQAGQDKILYTGEVSNDGKLISGRWTILSIWNGRFSMKKATEQTPIQKYVSVTEKEQA